MKVTYFGTGSQTTFDFSNPNKLCHILEGSPMICTLLLSIMAWNSTTPLFLSIDPTWKSQECGGFVIAFAKQHKMEAVEKISSLLAFFKHRFGEASLEYFAQEALNQAEMTQWDMEHDHLITQEEMFLDDIVAEEIEWIDNLKDAQFASPTDTPILLDHPSILLIPHPELPANTDANTVQTFFPGQSVASTQAPGVNHHTPSRNGPHSH